MDIYSERGSKVTFLNHHGREFDLVKARKYLKQGEIYTINSIEISGWSSKVFLKEVPETSFNTVMFDNIENKEMKKSN